jgi:hypothetical protein
MKNIRGKGPCTALLLTAFLAALVFSGCEQPGGTVNTLTPDSDAALRELSLSAGSLSPVFDPAQTGYTAEVGNSVEAITVSGTANSSYALVGGQNGRKQNLNVGLNPPIIITVQAQDGTTKTYTVTVTRLEKRLVTIETEDDLAKIGVDPGFSLAGEYRLEADLVLENWVPIGNGATVFSGQFDGGNHTITIKSFAKSVFLDKKTYLGLFGFTRGSAGSKTLIKDLKIKTEIAETINRAGVYYVGALSGYSGAYTELNNITVEGNLRFENTASERSAAIYTGGITGGLYGAELQNSSSSANIDACGMAGNGSYNYVGGLAGIFEQDTVIDPGAQFGTGTVSLGSSIINCHNTGNIQGRTSGARSNVFVGGVTGGSGYSFKTYYSGKIEDCSSTGTVTGRCSGGWWAFAGGIAGTIVGDGSANPDAPATDNPTGPTRIVRSYATGTISAIDAEWPYVGGIVGYNYYGALVSQCYFTGNVISDGDYDYTGGIAGYNSKQYYGHSSRIEDCWSSGTVQGGINAGGIVGQNQVAAITERCYSLSALSVRAEKGTMGLSSQQGMGGIAGYNAVSDGKAQGTVQNCVALNPSLDAPGGFDLVYRVIGNGGGTIGGNMADPGMTITISGSPSVNSDPGPNAKDGEDTATPKPTQSVYEALGWDFDTVWEMGDKGYPVLQKHT